MVNELIENTSYKHVTETNNELNKIEGKDYKIQVNPREINLFYLKEKSRPLVINKI